MAEPIGKKHFFEYVILRHQTPNKEDADKGQRVVTTVIKEPTHLLAANEQEATMIVAREIPQEFLERLDEIEVVIRPF